MWLFAAFIMACGTTHFLSIWVLWHPDYGVEGLVKAATAGVSVLTAVALWPLLPRAIALPSPTQLAHANADLSLRIAERDAARWRSTVRREPGRRSRLRCLGPGRRYEGSMLTVLIVEDEELVREIAQAECADAGYRVIEAASGEAAAAHLAGDPIDLLFTDIR